MPGLLWLLNSVLATSLTSISPILLPCYPLSYFLPKFVPTWKMVSKPTSMIAICFNIDFTKSGQVPASWIYPVFLCMYLSFIKRALYFSWRPLNFWINSSKLRSTCRGVCSFKFCTNNGVKHCTTCYVLHLLLEKDLIQSVPIWISRHSSLTQLID